MTTAAHSAARRRRWGRWLLVGLAIALVLFVALFAWDAYRLKGASAELRTEAAAAKAAVSARDAEALAVEVEALQESAVVFANATSGPHWWIANRLPWISRQTLPLTQAGQSVLAISDEALAPLAATGDLSSLEVPEIVDGRIDPYVLEPYRPVLEDAAAVFASEQTDLESVDVGSTIAAVREPFLDLRNQLTELGDVVQGAHVAAELLPQMLGADEPRTYLVMVQNNAEPRTTGGIPGAILEMGADDGRLTLKWFETANALINQDRIPGPLTDDEQRIFTGRMLIYPQDVNFTPEYPRSAELMAQFWAEKHPEEIDGVLSVDPVALGYMLAEMPPTEVQGVTITGENLSQVMLRDSYLTFPDPDDQDAFFALAARTLFGELLAGGSGAIAGTERAIDEGRFFVWSAAAEEQEMLATTAVAGGFLERADTMGVFLNDGSGSKIGYYIERETHVTNQMCADGSLGGQIVELTYTHGFDGDVADLPWYVSGGGNYVPEGEFHANVLLYPARDTGVTSVTINGKPGMLHPEIHDGRAVSSARIVLSPGETVTLRFEIAANEPNLLTPALVATPGQHPGGEIPTIDAAETGC